MATKTVRICDMCKEEITKDEPKGSLSFYTVDSAGHSYYPKTVRYARGNPQNDTYSQGECCYKLTCMVELAEWIFHNHQGATTHCNNDGHNQKNDY